MQRRLLLAFALLLATASSAVAARPFGPSRAPHGPGFFMRLAGGFGYHSATLDDAGETSLSGIGGQVSFAFGGTITRNLALHADLFGANVFEPTVKSNGVDQGDAENTSMSFGAIGIGVTGYIMPVNLYVSGSVGVGVGTLRSRFEFIGGTLEVEEDSDPGLAVNLMVGKEWLISRKWGIGLAGQVILGALETDDGTGLGILGFGVLFSATMN